MLWVVLFITDLVLLRNLQKQQIAGEKWAGVHNLRRPRTLS